MASRDAAAGGACRRKADGEDDAAAVAADGPGPMGALPTLPLDIKPPSTMPCSPAAAAAAHAAGQARRRLMRYFQQSVSDRVLLPT